MNDETLGEMLRSQLQRWVESEMEKEGLDDDSPAPAVQAVLDRVAAAANNLFSDTALPKIILTWKGPGRAVIDLEGF